MDTLVFAYYDTSMSNVTHLDIEGEPACGTAYGIDNGEFLYSKHEYDAGLMRSNGFDPVEVTCKKCLKILQRGKDKGE